MLSATQPTKLPVSLSPPDRGLLESVAQLKGLKLSTWIRVAAIEASRDYLAQRRAPEPAQLEPTRNP